MLVDGQLPKDQLPRLPFRLYREVDVLVNPFRCKLGWTSSDNSVSSGWSALDPNA